MRTLKDVKVGDEIVMIYRSGRMAGGKSNDKIVRAVVTIARPVNLEIRSVDQHPVVRVWNVRRDTRTALYGWYAYTAEEHEVNERRSAALTFLREQGIHISGHQSPWHGREIELAEVIKSGMQERGHL